MHVAKSELADIRVETDGGMFGLRESIFVVPKSGKPIQLRLFIVYKTPRGRALIQRRRRAILDALDFTPVSGT